MSTDLESIGTKRIDQDVIDAIQSGTWDELAFTMPQLERTLYQKVINVLDSFGGKWNRKAKAILFEDEDAMVSVLNACETGVYVDLKKAYQFFETPPEVADMLIERASIRNVANNILEPSAGKGALIHAIQRFKSYIVDVDYSLTAVDLSSECISSLHEANSNDTFLIDSLIHGDFLSMHPGGMIFGEKKFDRIIMNPPFAKSQDMAHVQHAYKFLTEGGRLVAVMSPGFTFRNDKRAVAFREWLDEVGGEWSPLPEGSFKSSGTNVNTVMVVIDKQ